MATKKRPQPVQPPAPAAVPARDPEVVRREHPHYQFWHAVMWDERPSTTKKDLGAMCQDGVLTRGEVIELLSSLRRNDFTVVDK